MTFYFIEPLRWKLRVKFISSKASNVYHLHNVQQSQWAATLSPRAGLGPPQPHPTLRGGAPLVWAMDTSLSPCSQTCSAPPPTACSPPCHQTHAAWSCQRQWEGTPPQALGYRPSVLLPHTMAGLQVLRTAAHLRWELPAEDGLQISILQCPFAHELLNY